MAGVHAKMSKFERIDHKKVASDDDHVYNVELIERTLWSIVTYTIVPIQWTSSLKELLAVIVHHFLSKH
jgi:hypothetical protein